MHVECLPQHQHAHSFGQERRRAGERRTRWVILITGLMMVGEVAAGLAFGSMALLADGLHMASHTVALGIAAFAYLYARRHAHDERFTFGTGKVNALGGFSGAVLLAVFALLMAVESATRLLAPVAIAIDQALLVAVLGLGVNVASALVLGVGHEHSPDATPGGETWAAGAHHEDHTLRSAYLHVLADALTSVAAILALLSGKLLGWTWMDPVMGLAGSVLVAHWSVGLLRQTSHVLLDHRAPETVLEGVRRALEEDGSDRLADLHVWSVGPGIWSVEGVLLSESPRSAEDYKARIPKRLGVVHATLEVVACPHGPG